MRERIELMSRNFCVTAGAGAGKTTCLVRAYLNLLVGGGSRPPLKPEQVAAITFTEKAAAEMRERIQQELARRARAKDPGADWEDLLAKVEWAPISTIHSFCAGLLREFGAHLGLDPDFAMLDEQEFGELLAETVAELWRVGLQENDRVLARVLAHHDLAELSALLTRLHAGLSTQGVSVEQARQATVQAHAEAMAQGPSLVEKLAGLVRILAESLAAGQISPKAKFTKKIKQIIQEWLNNKLLFGKNEKVGEAVAALAGLFSGNWGKTNEVRRAARDLLDRLADLHNVPAAAVLAENMLKLAGRLAKAVEREMVRRSALSFDHLLLLALRLALEHPEVLAELRRRYGALMVDEFQDVNPVQGRLIMLLAGLEEPDGSAPQLGTEHPRVLLVGDCKQSIYAFRGADVGVFTGAQQVFAAGAGELVTLAENFRSNYVIVNFFNDIFKQIMTQLAKTGPFPELALTFFEQDLQTPARPDATAPEQPIQVLDCRSLDAGDDAPLAAWHEVEAIALAEHLAGLITAGTPPGHIALLFRRLTQVGVYEKSLTLAGVPYYTVRGRGFYGCREVADLELALRAVLDPGDDLALAGLLRSPLAGLSDEALLALCFNEDGRFRTLGQALASGEPLPEWLGAEQGGRLTRVRKLLDFLRPMARRMEPAELLECMVESGDLLPMWHSTAGGAQRAANLRKLIEIARQPERGGSVEDFAQRLGELVASPSEDAQAPLLGEEAPVVRLMSVHQAKGLEFPVVVLPDLAAPIRDRDRLALGLGGVLGAAPWSPEQGRRLTSTVRRRVKERVQAVEQAEAARLFYVACTRARERLVFCLNGALDKNQSQWGRWVRDVVLPHPTTTVLNSGRGYAGAGPLPSPVEAWSEGLPPEPGAKAEEGVRLAKRALNGRPMPLTRVAESVSGMENWLECPRLWFFTSRLGLNTTRLDGAGQGGQTVKLGSMVHRLLELAELGRGPTGLAETLPIAAREFAGGEDLARQALVRAQGLWDTSLPDWLAKTSPEQLRREEPFHLFFDGGNDGHILELVGKFDLLSPLAWGGWLVVDYKVSAKVEPEKYCAQMALYALALWQGQNCAGPLPRLALCYLTPTGGRLAELRFSSEDLAQWRGRVLAAGREMAALPPQVRVRELPKGAHCRREACAVGRAGLCPDAA